MKSSTNPVLTDLPFHRPVQQPLRATRGLKKMGSFALSTASLVTGILVAVMIQAIISSIYDNF